MEKQTIHIKRKILPYRCFLCNTIVEVRNATPAIIESDKVIIHTFDYGHKHNRTIQMVGDEQYVVEPL